MSNFLLATELYWGISKSDWLQIGLATVALFGGGVVGARSAALSRMNVEDRRELLALLETLGRVRLQPHIKIGANISRSVRLNEAGPLEISTVLLGQGAGYDGLRATLKDACRVIDLLPLWDRLSFDRYYEQLDLGLRLLELIAPIGTKLASPGMELHPPSDDPPVNWQLKKQVLSNRWSGPLTRIDLIPDDLLSRLRLMPTSSDDLGSCTGGPLLAVVAAEHDWELFPNNERPRGTWWELDCHLRRQLRPGPLRFLRGIPYRLGLAKAQVSAIRPTPSRQA